MKLDFIDGLKAGKKLSGRDLQMILVFVGIIVFVLVYLFVFKAFNEKNTELDSKLEERGAYLEELKGYENNIQTYRTGVQNAKINIAKNIGRLPTGFEDEDFLIWYIRADEAIGSKTTSVSFNEVDGPEEFSTYIGGAPTAVKAYRASSTASMVLNYEQFKKYLEYIYEPSSKITYVDSVALTYDSESAKLQTSFSLSKFFIEYENGAYTGEKGFDVPFGNPNPFSVK